MPKPPARPVVPTNARRASPNGGTKYEPNERGEIPGGSGSRPAAKAPSGVNPGGERSVDAKAHAPKGQANSQADMAQGRISPNKAHVPAGVHAHASPNGDVAHVVHGHPHLAAAQKPGKNPAPPSLGETHGGPGEHMDHAKAAGGLKRGERKDETEAPFHGAADAQHRETGDGREDHIDIAHNPAHHGGMPMEAQAEMAKHTGMSHDPQHEGQGHGHH